MFELVKTELSKIPDVVDVEITPLMTTTRLSEKDRQTGFSLVGEKGYLIWITRKDKIHLNFFRSEIGLLDENVPEFKKTVERTISELHTTHSKNSLNFSGGPGVLPESVLKHLAASLLEEPELKYSILGVSHRTDWFKKLIQETKETIYRMSHLDREEYEILFLQGGSSLQFVMAPLNIKAYLAKQNVKGGYLDTGYWGRKAFEEGQKVCEASLVKTEEDLEKFDFIHYVSNETVDGTQFDAPNVRGPLVVCDASSDFLTRSCPKVDIIYAHAQKNLGPAGVTIIVVKKSLLAHSSTLPGILSYKDHSKADSILNTPPVFGIYALRLVLGWAFSTLGDVDAIERFCLKRAKILRDTLSASKNFKLEGNSPINIIFTSRNDKQFLAYCESKGIFGLEGHRSKGGLRASLYLGLPTSSVELLSKCITDFDKL